MALSFPVATRPTDPTPPASAPRHVGRYRLLGELGRGGMGVVYRAEDPRLGREVAVKVLPEALAKDPAAKARLLLEARAAATLDHPNVCTVYEVGETDDGRPYIVLACYDGETLAERLRRGPLAVAEAVRVGRAVAAGVAAAHARGIVHRDLKPSNIFLCADGTPKVLDFGVAKVPGTDLTQSGHTTGTLAYAAPEQARGTVDPRSDVWGIGVTLYEMLTGTRPFAADYEAAVLYAVLHEAAPPPSTLVEDIPPGLDAIVLRCLEKEPDARYPDAAGLVDALDEVLDPPSGRDRPAVPGRAAGGWRGLARPRKRVAAAVGGGLLLAAGLWAAQATGVFGGDPVHLAVLAFEPSSEEPDDRAFAEGLAETLASGVVELAPQGADVWVVPTSEVRSLGITTAGEARAALGATRAVTGRLVREGDRLTLTLDLIETGGRPRVLASRTLSLGGGQASQVRGQALLALAEMLGFEVTGDRAQARLARGTDDPEALKLYIAGLGYLERVQQPGDLGRSVELFELAIAEDSAFVDAYAKLAEAAVKLYADVRDPVWVARAEEAAAAALALDPTAPLAHVALSHLRHTTGAYAEAVAEARRALALDPTLPDALIALAKAQEAAGDPAAAEATHLQAIALRPTLWTGYAELGYLYWNIGEYEKAAAQFETIIELTPGNFQGYYLRAAVLQTLGDAAGARRNYEAANRIRPHYAAYNSLALLLEEEGDFEGATRMYRRALDMDATDFLIWGNYAEALEEAGDASAAAAYRRARFLATEALDVNPNDAYVLALRGRYAISLGDRAAALADVGRALAEAPTDVRVSLQGGATLAMAGLPERALEALRPAVESGYQLEDVLEDEPFAAVRALPGWPALLEAAPDPD